MEAIDNGAPGGVATSGFLSFHEALVLSVRNVFFLSRRTSLLNARAAAGIAYLLIDLALACRTPMSEACVWGKPLTLGVSLLIVGGIVTVLTYVLLARNRHRDPKHDS